VTGEVGRSLVSGQERPWCDTDDLSLPSQDAGGWDELPGDSTHETPGARETTTWASDPLTAELPATSAAPGEARPAHPDQATSSTMPRPAHEVPIYWTKPEGAQTDCPVLPEWFATAQDGTKEAVRIGNPEDTNAALRSYNERVAGVTTSDMERVCLATPDDLDKPSDKPRGVEDMDLHALIDIHQRFEDSRKEYPTELVVPGKIHGMAVPMLVDSGATVSIVSTRLWKKLRDLNPKLTLLPTDMRLMTASGAGLQARGLLLLEVELGGQYYLHQFTVVDAHEQAILGLDFMARHDAYCYWRRGVLLLRGTEVKAVRQYSIGDGRVRRLSVYGGAVVPAGSQCLVEACVKKKDREDLPDWGMIQPIKQSVSQYGVLAGKAVVDSHAQTVFIPVLNPSDTTVVLPPYAQIALMAPVSYIDHLASPLLCDDEEESQAPTDSDQPPNPTSVEPSSCQKPDDGPVAPIPTEPTATRQVDLRSAQPDTPITTEQDPGLPDGSTETVPGPVPLPKSDESPGLDHGYPDLGIPPGYPRGDLYHKEWSDLSSECNFSDEEGPETKDPPNQGVEHAHKLGVPDHLIDLFVDSIEELGTEAEIERLANFLKEYQDVFATESGDLGRTDIVQHRINTGDSQPIRQPPRRVPIHKRPIVQAEVEKMLAKGVVEPCDGPWSSPVVLAAKKGGETRFCVDYRALNDVTKKDAYPLPRIEDNLDTLQGAVWYSTLDLLSGFWQVEMAPEDRDKTAFTVGGMGLFRFLTMPFGLCNAPATFERLMERVLAGLQWEIAVLYIDDIVVFSNDLETHLARLGQVLQRLRTAGLKLKPVKCKLLKHRVEFLGHIVSHQGVEVDPGKVRKVLEWVQPQALTQVRSFIGLCAYYRRFIPDFSTLAKPLFGLMEKGAEFRWGESQERAFRALKEALTKAPVLAYPKPDIPYILDTDASNFGIGAVLSQVQDDEERVIAFASKTLNRAQRNYCVTRREALAIITFIKQFHHYLYGAEFLVRTDHAALYWLLRKRDPEGQMARWLAFLQGYRMRIEHRPGKKHGNADALSRCMEGCRDTDNLRIPPGTTRTMEEIQSQTLAHLRPVKTRAQARKEAQEEADEREQALDKLFGKDDSPSHQAKSTPSGGVDTKDPGLDLPGVDSDSVGASAPEADALGPEPDQNVGLDLPGVDSDSVGASASAAAANPQADKAGIDPAIPSDPLVGMGSRPERRQQTPQEDDPWELAGEDERIKQFLADEDPDKWAPEALAYLQDRDPVVAKVKAWLKAATKPTWEQVVGEGALAKTWWGRWDQLYLSPGNGVLYVKWESQQGCSPPKHRVVAVPVMHQAILRHLHDAKTAGHLGQAKTVDRVKRGPFYWPGMVDYALRWVRGCNVCAAKKHPTHSKRTPLQVYYCGATGDRYACDICGPFDPPTPRGNHRIFTILDWYTRYIKAYPIKRRTAQCIAPCVVDFISTFGIPLELYSDNGKELVGEVMQTVCQLLGITKLNTTAYRPSSNGIVERDNGTMKAMLSAFVNRRGNDWDEHLDAVMMAYRSSVHRTLGETPNMMMFGREVRLPLDALIPPPPEVEYETLPPAQYAAHLTEVLRDAHQVVTDHVGDVYRYQKKQYDRNVKPQDYQVGQAVWLRIYPKVLGQSRCLMRYWDETWVVMARVSLVHYRIRKTPTGKVHIVHGDRLKIHYGLILDPATKRLWLALQPGADRVQRLAVVESQL